MKYNETESCDLKIICDLFASFFQSNFKISSLNSENVMNNINAITNMGHIELTENEVLLELGTLDSSISLPPDNIPALFLKSCKSNLSKALVNIFNLSLSEGVFLDYWKSSYITPIFKSGSKQSVANYRPIAKLQLIPKVFESLVKKRMYEAVKDFISPFQHGFVSGKSTATNLTLLTNFCVNAVENGSQVDVVYTDFSKAFDRVNHAILLQKLKSLGFHSKLLKWIESYLTNRIQYVKIGPEVSKMFLNVSGVPQGSHLGPLLFLLFINDLPSHISFSSCLIFADDVKIYKVIKSLVDFSQLQSDLNNFYNWCILNDLSLYVEKCSILSFSRSFSTLIFNYELSDNELQRVYNHKDLGVIFDCKLEFKMHVDYIVSRGNSLLGFITRNSKDFKCPYTFKSLYVNFVRPVLEYCSVAWCPYYKNASNRIKKIQKRFTRYSPRQLEWNLPLPPYKDRCTLIDLMSLEARREYFLISFARDIVTGCCVGDQSI